MKREMIVVPYDENWKNDFEEIKKTLITIYGDLALDIQHFGSTSMNGMPAKPIIDIMVLVSDIYNVDKLNEKMKDVGYVAKGENGISGRRYFQKFHEDGVNHLKIINML